MMLRPMTLVGALVLSSAACGDDDDPNLCPEPTPTIATPSATRANLSMVPECTPRDAEGMLAPTTR